MAEIKISEMPYVNYQDYVKPVYLPIVQDGSNFKTTDEDIAQNTRESIAVTDIDAVDPGDVDLVVPTVKAVTDYVAAHSGGGSGLAANATRYRALVSQSAGVFTIAQLENTIGDGSNNGVNDIGWTAVGTDIRATMSAGTPFTIGKTFIPSLATPSGPYFIVGFRASDNILTFKIFLHDGTTPGVPTLTNLPVEICVYA